MVRNKLEDTEMKKTKFIDIKHRGKEMKLKTGVRNDEWKDDHEE